MRLIDADKVNTNDIIVFGDKPMTQKDFDHAVRSLLHVQQTIDPETIPIVQELREQLAKVTAERDAAVEDLKTAANDSYECYGCKWLDCINDICINPKGLLSCDTGKNNMWEYRGLETIKSNE